MKRVIAVLTAVLLTVGLLAGPAIAQPIKKDPGSPDGTHEVMTGTDDCVSIGSDNAPKLKNGGGLDNAVESSGTTHGPLEECDDHEQGDKGPPKGVPEPPIKK